MHLKTFICIVGAMAATSCGAQDASVASFTYEPGQAQPLLAYPLEPAAETRDAEKLMNNFYGGILHARSPRVLYVCVWRPTSKTGFVPPSQKTGPWEEILMTCHFGTSAWIPPSNLVELAEEANKREHAILRVRWKRQGEDYVPFQFRVELSKLHQRLFISNNEGARALSDIQLVSHATSFPVKLEDPLSFSFSAQLKGPEKPNEWLSGRFVTITTEGVATPVPDWLAY